MTVDLIDVFPVPGLGIHLGISRVDTVWRLLIDTPLSVVEDEDGEEYKKWDESHLRYFERLKG